MTDFLVKFKNSSSTIMNTVSSVKDQIDVVMITATLAYNLRDYYMSDRINDVYANKYLIHCISIVVEGL